MQKKLPASRVLGTYIVADRRICHGAPTFKGTRKLVRDCLELAATGLTLDEIAIRTALPRAAIVEALQLAAQVLNRYYVGRSANTSLHQEQVRASA
jgi:uncharacterized protein (DUF433 family)